MDYEIIIVGGGFAGQAAAMQLARARRHVLLFDAGSPRNRFAKWAHGFLGQDGRTPPEIAATFRDQLAAYSTVRLCETEAIEAAALDGGFSLNLADGRRKTARHLILATGVRDVLPDVPGLKERWGITALHCPYCHGYELDQQPIGVLARNELALHQAMLVPDWGPTTLFTQRAFTLGTDQMEQLSARSVTIETSPIVELLGKSPELEAVRLDDGRVVPVRGLFLAPATVPASDLAGQLGCAFADGLTGPVISVDGRQQTSVPGVFAAGDAANPMANATIAAASGVMAAASAHHALIHGLSE